MTICNFDQQWGSVKPEHVGTQIFFIISSNSQLFMLGVMLYFQLLLNIKWLQTTLQIVYSSTEIHV